VSLAIEKTIDLQDNNKYKEENSRKKNYYCCF